LDVLVFDIETIPDLAGGRRLHDTAGLSDDDVRQILLTERRQQAGTEFLRHPLHRVVAISVLLRSSSGVKLWTLGEEDSDERDLIQRFFDGIARYSPQLVSWNGSGFDLPVLHYRALIHGVQAPRYWDVGDQDRDFKWNNYLSRFHQRHLDLMDVLAGYQPRSSAPLDQIAQLLGFPGKHGMHGSEVDQAFQDGRIREIREYCESDVLNTYLVYLRFELMRGNLDAEGHRAAEAAVRELLTGSDAPHLAAFLAAWEAASPGAGEG
jgi:predicted PolB exonuclease-like 3'-5' exonuclease